MGWLTKDLKDEKLHYSDQSLDDCADFLRKIGEEYSGSELERLPTLEEILLNLEIVLGANMENYCSNANDIDLVGIFAKTQKRPAQIKAKVGDIVAVPFKRDLFGFIQVIEMKSSGKSGTIGVYPYIARSTVRIESLRVLEFIAQSQIELTGISWKHWRVIGNLPVDSGLKVAKFLSYKPCFVAELQILEELKSRGAVDKEFKLYEDLRASHPKLRSEKNAKLETIMKFLKERQLLSKAGLDEIKSEKLQDDFSMHSELLTVEGRRFYDHVFKKDYQSDYFYTDTYNKLVALWEEVR